MTQEQFDQVVSGLVDYYGKFAETINSKFFKEFALSYEYEEFDDAIKKWIYQGSSRKPPMIKDLQPLLSKSRLLSPSEKKEIIKWELIGLDNIWKKHLELMEYAKTNKHPKETIDLLQEAINDAKKAVDDFASKHNVKISRKEN